MACLGLVTFWPELDLSLPVLNSCMTLPTFLLAAAFFLVGMELVLQVPGHEPVLHVHAAVYIEDCSRDIGGFVACQECHGFGDVFGLAETA